MGQVKPKDRWTREEQRLYAHGWLDLISAVVRQWKTDGMPSTNTDTIKTWIAIQQELQDDKK